MFWVCLRFPQLALDAVRVEADAHNHRGPIAVIDGPMQRRHVVLANATATRSGVHGGQALTAAQMLCPQLRTLPRDAAAERQTLESLAAWAYRYSAEVHIATPDSVFIEAGASLALFGGWPALQRRLCDELRAFGFGYSFAAAPTATAAHVFAMQANGIAVPAFAHLANALGTAPLCASGLDAKTVAALQGMGFRTLHDLFRLPRAELARRIGQDALDHLDRMRGLASETLLRWRPPERFERRIEFPFGVESHTALAFPLQRLMREFALFLTARDGGVQRFALVLGHERGASTRVEVGLLAPQRDAASLFELARTRLERIELAAAVHALTLCADDLPPLCPLHQDLFEPHSHRQADWPALAERLRARLGDAALNGIRCVADHRPARAWEFASAITDATTRSRGASGSRDAAVRPAGRKSIAAVAALTPAKAGLARRADKRDMPPAQDANPRPFWLLRRPIPLRGLPPRVLAGPERIESGWWDGHDQRRDYYLVETRSGQRAWAFVEAGSPVGTGTAQWTLHGWFA